MKLKQLLSHITKPVRNHPSDKPFFGKVAARVNVVEFQKRGLPHAHILLILDGRDKPRTPDDYDRFVHAELPDKEIEPMLYDLLVNNMLHGPCGAVNPNAPRMVDGKCSKRFPKAFQQVTEDGGDGYPLYRRRDDGRTHQKNGFTFDNRWVVPYNPHLLLLTQTHTNVEICITVMAYKY